MINDVLLIDWTDAAILLDALNRQEPIVRHSCNASRTSSVCCSSPWLHIREVEALCLRYVKQLIPGDLVGTSVGIGNLVGKFVGRAIIKGDRKVGGGLGLVPMNSVYPNEPLSTLPD